MRPACRFQPGAEQRAGLGTKLRESDHVRIMTNDRVGDADEARSAAVLKIPGEEFHQADNRPW